MFRLLDKVFENTDNIDKNQLINLLRKVGKEYEILEVVLNSLPYGVIVLSSGNKLEFANKNVDWLFPLLNRKASSDLEIWNLISDSQISATIEESLLKGVNDELEFTISTILGEKMVALSVIVMAKKGSEVGTILILEDVTLKNHQINQLLQAERLVSLTNMTATVAHEIKNPLAGIGLYGDLIERTFVADKSKSGKNTILVEQNVKDKIDEYLRVVNSEISRLNQIISNYLLSVKPSTGSKLMISINVILSDLISFYEEQMSTSHIKLKFDLGNNLPLVFLDEGSIRQALVNLINNAIHALEKSSNPEILIRSYFSYKDQQVVISIKDNGCGIAEEDKESIFKPYFTRRETGTGLGLFVVEKIISEHGGKIQCVSALNEGTEFKISFPLINNHQYLIDENSR